MHTAAGLGKGHRADERGGDGVSLLSWTRPGSYWDVVVAHLPLALIAGMALALPHVVACHELPLIPCTFLQLTGYPCPFCGVTRSFWAVAHGDWGFAALHAPLACLVYVTAVLMFAWHATGLVTGRRLRSGLSRLATSHTGLILVSAVILFNWIYRLGSHLQ